MIDIKKLPAYILEDVRERGHTDEQIARMEPEEVFEEYCNWNGIIGWNLWSVAEHCRKAVRS